MAKVSPCSARAALRRPRTRRHRAAVAVFTVAATVLGVLGVLAPASATAGDVGYRGPSTSGAGKPPSSDKPESKLWYAAGQWWAVMWNAGLHRYDIARLDRPTHTWVDTGVVVDTRANSLADALWDGTHLFVASHVVTVSSDASPSPSKSGNPARLLRYTYASGSNSYTLDAGFPTQINNNSSESMTIDEDSARRIWATWTQVASTVTGYTNTVYTNVSADGGTAWGTPSPIPSAGAVAAPDDISSVVAFGHSRIGVLWSNQVDGNFYWAVRTDDEPLGQWTTGVAAGGSHYADDHMSLKSLQSDAAGRVFAVVKTSLNDVSNAPGQPQVVLLTFIPASSSWTETTAYTVGDCPTRPIVVMDETNQQVKVIVTAPDSGCPFSGTPGTIFMKTTSMSSPSFVTGRGTPIIKDAASANMNDATTTKQGVTTDSGLVVLATNQSTHYYWFNDLPIGGLTPPAPTAAFTASPTAGVAPLAVQFTDTSTGSPTAWSWDFGDGTTSTTQNPSHAYSASGTYSVSLTASNGTGSTTVTKAGLVTVSPPSTGGVSFHGSATGANTTATSLTVPEVSAAVAGDVELAAVTVRGNPTITAPPGWTLVRQDVNSTTNRTAVYSRTVTSAQPGGFTWTFSSSHAAAGIIVAYGGVSTASPVDVSGGQITTTSTTPITAPSVTTTAAGEVQVGFMSAATATTIAPAAGASDRGQVNTPSTTYKVSVEAEDRVGGGAGSTGTLVATAGKSSANIGQLVALRAG